MPLGGVSASGGVGRYQRQQIGEQRQISHAGKRPQRRSLEAEPSPEGKADCNFCTDSNHDGPIFPNLAKNIVPTGSKMAAKQQNWRRSAKRPGAQFASLVRVVRIGQSRIRPADRDL